MIIETEKFCNAKEAAKLYGCSVKRIYQLAKEREIKAIEFWGFKVFDKESVKAASERLTPRRARISGEGLVAA